MIVCLCTGITTDQFNEALRENGMDWARASFETGAGTCCGGCRHYLAQMAEREQEKMRPVSLPMLGGTPLISGED